MFATPLGSLFQVDVVFGGVALNSSIFYIFNLRLE